jgi:hypothetical protein
VAVRARTLREFVTALEAHEADGGGYLQRGDFSRWIGDVFGDRALADEIRAWERRARDGAADDALRGIAGAIRGRYDLNEDTDVAVATPLQAA